MKYYSVYSYRGQPSVDYDNNERYSSWFTVHNPYIDENIFVYDSILNLQDSVSGTFTFKVPITHPNSLAFDCGLIVEIREFDDEPSSMENASIGGNPIWIGRLINLSSDIYGNLNCICEGPLGFLKDGFISATNAPWMPSNTTVLDYIKLCIEIFINGFQGESTNKYSHARQPGLKFIDITSNISVTPSSHYLGAHISTLKDFETKDGQSHYNGSEPKNIFDFIKEYFETGLSSISGIQYANEYVWMNARVIPKNIYNDYNKPKTDGLRLILGLDDISQGVSGSRQRIIFGENLVNAELEYDFNNIATSLMVLGAEYEDENGNTVRYNLNGATDTGTMERINGWYIDADNGAIEKYGVIQKTVVNDNLDSQGQVALWANMNRNALSNPVVSFKCAAVDLSIFDPNQDDFTLGEYAEVRFPGLDKRDTMFYYRCTGIKKNLMDASKDEFTFSYSRETTLTSNSIFKNTSTTAGSSNAAASGGSETGGSKYELPIATSEILGGIKVGHNLAITDDGVLRMTYVDEGRKEGTTVGERSTAEGYNTVASGDYSHAEGEYRHHTFPGMSFTVTGGPVASGRGSHSEGGITVASGDYSHAEGCGSYIKGQSDYSTYIPLDPTTASGICSHAEGAGCLASDNASHAEGIKTKALGGASHAEGFQTTASGFCSHAQGCQTTALGDYSHAGGLYCSCSLPNSIIHGYYLIANSNPLNNSLSAIAMFGAYNTIMTDEESFDHDTNPIFIIGNGSYDKARSNAFRITHNAVYGLPYNSSGADYAELFEWGDSNPNNEDRLGRFVTLNGEYISLADSNTPLEDILGIISGNPSIAGDVYDDQWSGMYLTDVYGRPIYEEVHHDVEFDDEGNIIREAYDSMERKVNPEYDHTKPYKPRSQRPEWDYVGLVGKLVMLDDGTAKPNDYVRSSEDGIATRSETRTRYKVMKRIDEDHIRISILLG